ncbi:MAG TPA: zf-HC2 domain-containing protein, partial [Thermoanaerobaculia bacterium]|nr:zf-HC2 domain-containing protein [Thermoanaerobaculia bacterium]
MPEHLSGEEAGRYRHRALSAAELLRIDEHLATCTECRGSLASADDLASLAALLSSADLSHLEYEQLAAYADGSADAIDRELVDTHAADCALCRRELKDLQKFAQKPPHLWRWAIAAAAAILIAIFVTVPGPRASRPVVSLTDGGRQVTLRSDGQLTGLPRLSAAQQRAIARALTNGELPQVPNVAALRGSQHTLLGATDPRPELRPVAPLGCIVIDDRPTLEWNQLPGVTRYRAELFDSHFRPVAASGVLRETRWTVDVPLRRGETYVWQVTA